ANIFGMVTTAASADYTPYALKTFFQNTPMKSKDQFFLIDNDGGWQGGGDFPAAVSILRNESPRGFAANVNQVLRIAAGEKADLYFLNNDLIFTPRWIEPLMVDQAAVISPLSNARAEYKVGNFVCKRFLDLKDYLGHESAVKEIARH